ncbi:MAG TPA: sodium:alanine symporter family protein [Candidatus Nesterenkonia stercoripullorum]|uniref:Sodium:alanine symporter family protein n=1 Tax=Candidatus Nesterenkonia stercoripullorum TaxID=2838701 RepID=A0A9D1UUK7_9MICC|nr:sodium:alanine symporter family protein [Candidatus Nesterenkonia stercoripullorum]
MNLDAVEGFLDSVNSVVWGKYMLIPLLVLAGVILTWRLRGVQFHKLIPALKLGLLRRYDADSSGDITQFQALATALAATVGTGNIVGVSTAIAIGGPGALFWMWVTGVLGMASKYTEAFLGVRFRGTDQAGEKSGGPQVYLERGIKGPLGRVLGLAFAVFAVLACFGIGNTTQGNAIAANAEHTWSIPTWVTGLVLSAFVMVVLVGGIKSVGRVSSTIVPTMIALFMICQGWILILHLDEIPAALGYIFTDAFTGSSAVGGFAGAAIMIVVQNGMSRGLFSNESGLGSAAIAAAAAQTTHPVRQGLVSMTQTFIDTIILVTLTGLSLVVTGIWSAEDAAGEQMNPALMVGEAFSTGMPGDMGHWVVTLSLILFASTTILGWSYYGERNVERLFGRGMVMPFRLVFAVVVYFGCTVELTLVWVFADVMNGLMALPNLIGLIILSGLVARETKHYLRHDPGLVADKAQIESFMRGQPGWQQWKAGDIIGSSRDFGHRPDDGGDPVPTGR